MIWFRVALVGLLLSLAAWHAEAAGCKDDLAEARQRITAIEAQKATLIEWLQETKSITEIQKVTLLKWLKEAQASVLSVLK